MRFGLRGYPHRRAGRLFAVMTLTSLTVISGLTGVATATTCSGPSGQGYWLVASDGGVFSFGDAHYYGSEGGTHLNRSIVGIAGTFQGNGYTLAASDGGIFTFGDSHFCGSTGAVALAKPVVGISFF